MIAVGRVLCLSALGLSALAMLVVASLGGATTAARPSLATLLVRHTPVLVLHPAEPFKPVPVEGFLAESDLYRRSAAGWERVDAPLPVGGADHRLDQRLCRAIEGVAATLCYARAERTHRAPAVVYGAAFPRKSRIDLQYWLWYPFNPYSPTVPAGQLWQVHEGDWEAISVILDLAGRPLAAVYSQHSEGIRRDWAKVPKRGLRPLVYVALGSHANYFTAGKHRFDRRVVNPLFISVIEQNGQQPVDNTGRGRIVQPRLVRVTTRTPAWMAFAGRWGKDEYIRVPGGRPTPTGASGPLGPAYHEQWRAPVTEVLSWPRG